MAIALTNPITIPAVTIPEKAADQVWITNITINAPSPTKPINTSIFVVPMVSSTGEILTSQQKRIQLTDTFKAAETNPEVGKAIAAIFSAVQDLVAKQNTFNTTIS